MLAGPDLKEELQKLKGEWIFLRTYCVGRVFGRSMVDSNWMKAICQVSSTAFQFHPLSSHRLPHFHTQLDSSGLLNQLLLGHWLSPFQNVDAHLLHVLSRSFHLCFHTYCIAHCHFGNREMCLTHISSWNFSMSFYYLCVMHCLVVFFLTPPWHMCSIAPRVPDGWSQIDKRISPSGPVHHSHGGTQVQEPLPHSSRELPVQLLPERPAAGQVWPSRSLARAGHTLLKALVLQGSLTLEVRIWGI